MDECIFCQIVGGKLPSTKIYENDNVLALLNIQAINPGHTLVIPKKHVEEFQDLQGPTYEQLMATVQNVARSLKKTYKPVRVGLMVQGFEVAHAHIHVVPLFDATDVTSKKILEGTAQHPSPEEMNSEAKKVKSNLA